MNRQRRPHRHRVVEVGAGALYCPSLSDVHERWAAGVVVAVGAAVQVEVRVECEDFQLDARYFA
jgi:hypothetical protein